MKQLEKFIILAKQQTYVGGGQNSEPCRLGSHDLTFTEGDWSYRDSYFGGTDFLGQETVWHSERPIWAMNYYGYILRPDLIDAERAGAVIKEALSSLYKEGRFLGGYECLFGEYRYRDEVGGDYRHFDGVETIILGNETAYTLKYHGGMVKD
ncbi:DUF5680 domain-containing protein [Halovulum sp. GXIMD14793]